MPITEVLQLMRQVEVVSPAEAERSEVSQPQAARSASAARHIELKHKIPEGSDSMKAVAKCVQY